MTEIDRGALADNLGLSIRRAHGAVQRHFSANFAELGLTQKQVSVMWLTGEHPGLAQTDLARALDMDRATTMALVHGLEKRGLMMRGASPSDGRRIAFRLTDDGAELLTRAKEAIAAHEQWLKGRFDAQELATLHELLRRVFE